MKIGNRNIGINEKPIVIVEIGINHNGSLKIAKEMVEAAYQSGAEIIKHQTHVVEDEMSSAAQKVIPGNSDKSIYEIMESCALNESDETLLKEFVESKGMIFISTPFSRAAADRLERMNVQAYKIGSGECNNYPLLEHVASFNKPIILSTGMNDIASVKKAVKIFEKFKTPYALLHTTNLYPTPPHLVRLGAMEELKNEFPNIPIGLSDHTINNYACLGALALGASILERHFTDSLTDRDGPDICCSMDPKQLEDLLEGVEYLYQERGGTKNLLEEEQVTRDFAYATVVSIKPIQKGECFSKENIWVKRPGTGSILAEEFDSIIGKKANQNISTDIHLNLEMIE